MRSATPESCGNADGVETVEIQQQDFHRSHSVLEISRKQRDSHIPTAPTVCYRVSTKQPRLKNWVRWKSGNPKAGFPLSHRTDGLRRKEETPESVYNAPGTMCIPCAGIDSVFITFGGPAGPWELPHGRGSVTLLSEPRA